MGKGNTEVIEGSYGLNADQKNVAIQILELEDEAEGLDFQIKAKRAFLLGVMRKSDIQSIKTSFGTFTASERKNIKIDKNKAEKYLDSIREKAHYMKLDETKVKNVFYNPDADSDSQRDFIKVEESTAYLSITKEKV